MIASYISEVVLALEPWPAGCKMPMITPGAASNDITKRVHDDYEHYKYVFHGWLTSASIAQSICDFEHDVLIDHLHMKTTVVMSEDAAWTTPLDARYLECLPKAGAQGARSYPLLPRHHRLHADLQQDRGREARRHRHRHQPCRRAADGAVAAAAGADPDGRAELAGHHQHLLEGHQRRHRGRDLRHRPPRRTWR